MRLAGRERLGFYPLPIPEAERLRRFLRFPDQQCSVLDPCIADGVAFNEIASDKMILRYGVELDAGRAEQARTKGIEVIHGNCFDVQCPVESFSLVYLNPPYDFEIGEEKSQRMEKLFLEHVHRWLIRGGILVFVVPARRITDCAALLSRDFRDARVYRLTEAESARYKQVVLLGVGRTRQERDRLPVSEIIPKSSADRQASAVYRKKPLAKRRKVRDNQNVRNSKTVRGDAMQHSTVTSKGQTTIPGKIRKALRIKPGDKLEYLVEGNHATIRVHPGTRSLKGALASKKGKGMSFAQIREAAAEAARGRDDVR